MCFLQSLICNGSIRLRHSLYSRIILLHHTFDLFFVFLELELSHGKIWLCIALVANLKFACVCVCHP